MASTQPEPPMILGNCISCNGLMRVPVTTDVTHVARCPHCETGFPVQQLIASAIPAAEIIKGEVAEDFTPVVDRVRETSDEDDSVKPRTRFEVPKQLYNGAKFRRRRRRRSRGSDERKEQAEKERANSSRSKVDPSSVPLAPTQAASSQAASSQSTSSQSASATPGTGAASVVDEVPRESSRSRSSSSSSDSPSSSSRSSRSQSSRRRSSSHDELEDEPDSALEWLKIAVGGFIAFPLAYLGLMWILGLDPFGLAPTISKVVPFVVPSSLLDDDTLPLSSEFDDFESDFDDSLPMPSIDPDDIRG